MKTDNTIYLPGTEKQFNHLKNNVSLEGQEILIIGSNSVKIAEMFSNSGAKSITIIVEDYESLLNSRIMVDNGNGVNVRLMEFTNTDFINDSFDIVYTQASISTKMRNKIVKEIKRILKPEGILNVGEITSLKSSPPKFVNDIWESGNILPMNSDDIKKYYEERKFEVVDSLDLSAHLKDFYLKSKKLLFNNIDSLSENEKAYYKKLLKRMSHESNAYLKLGGEDYMGFTSIIVRRAS
ncbi:MAG: methyltransferase domain-containing protein [Bacteroidetes bacterium]|nr:methyltransferase domain-containing protein [Bacteroidota bacterium]